MSRARRARNAPAITEAQWAYLNDALTEDIGKPWERYELRCDNPISPQRGSRTNRQLWDDFGALVLQRWVRERPGTRPTLWWRFNAPRMAERPIGYWPDGETPPQLRLRVGGTGTPLHECSNYTLRQTAGIPGDWAFPGVPDPEEILPVGYQEEVYEDDELVDPDDPPLFESQAAYLQRHGLLLPGERRRLKAADFAPEALDIL